MTSTRPTAPFDTITASRATGEGRFAGLDTLRGIAALAIVAVHAADAAGLPSDSAVAHLLARLDVGVAVFFVLSGFLLFRPFVSRPDTALSGQRLRRYGRRRLARIIPAYWFALAGLTILFGLPGFTDPVVVGC